MKLYLNKQHALSTVSFPSVLFAADTVLLLTLFNPSTDVFLEADDSSCTYTYCVQLNIRFRNH